MASLWICLVASLLSSSLARIKILDRSNHQVANLTDVQMRYYDGYTFVLFVQQGISNAAAYSLSSDKLTKPLLWQELTKNDATRRLVISKSGDILYFMLCDLQYCTRIPVSMETKRFGATATRPTQCGTSNSSYLLMDYGVYTDQARTLYMNSGTNLYKLSCTTSSIIKTNLLCGKPQPVVAVAEMDGVSYGLFRDQDTGNNNLCVYNLTTGETAPESTRSSDKGILSLAASAEDPFISLAVTRSNFDQIVFAVSKKGRLRKIYVSSTGAYVIDEYLVPDLSSSDSMLSGMSLVEDRLILASNREMFLLDVAENCAEQLDLCSCRKTKNPTCGWCNMQSICTQQKDCNNSIWLKADVVSEEFCIDYQFMPRSAPRSAPEQVTIRLIRNETLSRIAGKYQCHYGRPELSTSGDVQPDFSIVCGALPISSVDSLLPSGTSAMVPISIYIVREQQYLPLAVPFRLVLCSYITSCEECVVSHSTCVWCKNNFRCTNNTALDCPLSTAEALSPFGDVSSCPRITMDYYTVPWKHPYKIVSTAVNFPTWKNLSYSCNIAGADANTTRSLLATREQDRIICVEHTYDQPQTKNDFLLDSFVVNITTLTDGKSVSLGSSNVTLYDCSFYTVCSNCLQESKDSNFSCVWCQSSGQCSYQTCAGLSPDNIVRSQCPSLDIAEDQVTPRYVPKESGFDLKVSGKGPVNNNGNTSVMVQDKPCKNLITRSTSNRQYELSCTLPEMESFLNASLVIKMNGIAWERKGFIAYYDPVLQSIEPTYGPLAGETPFEVIGQNLSALPHQLPWRLSMVNVNNESEQTDANCTVVNDRLSCFTPPADGLGWWYLRLTYTEIKYQRTLADVGKRFEYRPNSEIYSMAPTEVVMWGNTPFKIYGKSLSSVDAPTVQFGEYERQRCTKVSQLAADNQNVECLFPEFSAPGSLNASVHMDGIRKYFIVQVKPNPFFRNFTNGVKEFSSELIIEGANISVPQADIEVKVGEHPCNITSVSDALVVCRVPELEGQEREKAFVTVKIYKVTRFTVGRLTYEGVPEPVRAAADVKMIAGIAGGGGAIVLIMLLVAFLLCRRARYHKQRYKSMVKHVDQLESNVRNEIKQAFAELQTDMSDLVKDLSSTGIPYWDYKSFAFKILFPGQPDHPSLHKLKTKRKTTVMLALDKFEHLVYNKHFLISFIRTLEEQPTFTMSDKVQVAALLMIILQHKMDYATSVLKELLSELIETSMRKKSPKLLLRRSESVVEKMLTHWLSLCLYKYLQDFAGQPLFMMYKAIKHQIEKGPVDAITGEARYSLSQDRLLREKIDCTHLILNVQLDNGESLQCRVNDCDSITQVKDKILDAVYKNQAYSMRPLATDFNLEWHPGIVGSRLCDEDLTSQTQNGWKQINTLKHYAIPDNAEMKLVSRHNAHSLHSEQSKDTDKLCDTLSTTRGTLGRNLQSSGHNLTEHYVHNHISLWHLTKHQTQTLPKDKPSTMISEIFLTRLLKTKGTLQDFIEEMFKTIFSTESIPPTIKFLFDFLDQEAVKHGITDPEVVHIWKNNSLNLRFWVNIIKNPEFVFDIHKPDVVDGSLSVVAQTFIDSCSMTEADIGPDAPVNKLLFARDRPRYQEMVQNFYNVIKSQPSIPDATLNAHLSELSKTYSKEFYRNSALKEIYQYAQRYHTQIINDLEEGFPKHRNPNLTSLLKEVHKDLDDASGPLHDYV